MQILHREAHSAPNADKNFKKERTLKTKLLTVLLTLCLALSIVPITVFADSGSYAVKFYPGDYGTMTKNDQIPFVYYGIDDDVNKPYYYKLNVSGTETLGFAGSIMDTLLPNSGYEFAYWTADAAVYQVGSGTAIPAGTALSSDQIQNSVNVRSDNVTFTAQFKQISEYPEDSVITSAAVQNVKFDYQPGDAPQATAEVYNADADKYEIAYECWQEFENNEPVAAWYSDNGSHGSLPTITEFESGEKYVYFLMLKPKDGHSFSSETAVTVNAESAKSSLSGEFLYVPAVKTITMPTLTVIDVVEINGATVSFQDGDRPVFTGDVPDDVYYVLRAAWWELNSTTGLISTEPEFGSGIYENKIATFEAGKTYHYGVYVVAYVDVGNVRYVFGPDTKLKINGEFVNYKRYEGDASDGSDGTMWVLTDLTMTPEAGGTTPAEKYTVTYTDGVEGEEIFKDQTYTVEAGKATPAFNGTPARDGYKFTGWTPAVADTVTRNATYTAQWEKLTPAETFTVTYTDGVDNEEIFKDQTYTVESGKATPAFNGTPTRKGYTFVGWKPAVAATVTGNATYEATWKSNTTTTTPSDNKPSTGETTSPKTGDTSNIVLWAALLFVSCGALAGTLVIDKKKKTMK